MNDKEILKGVIDRFEGKLAVIEIAGESELRNVSRKMLPRGAKEGDHLRMEIQDGEVLQVEVDSEATDATQKRIQNKLDRLRRGEHLHDDD